MGSAGMAPAIHLLSLGDNIRESTSKAKQSTNPEHVAGTLLHTLYSKRFALEASTLAGLTCLGCSGGVLCRVSPLP